MWMAACIRLESGGGDGTGREGGGSDRFCWNPSTLNNSRHSIYPRGSPLPLTLGAEHNRRGNQSKSGRAQPNPYPFCQEGLGDEVAISATPPKLLMAQVDRGRASAELFVWLPLIDSPPVFPSPLARFRRRFTDLNEPLPKEVSEAVEVVALWFLTVR